MIVTKVLEKAQSVITKRHAIKAFQLAAALPPLSTVRGLAAASTMYGLHGRRHPGVGENFWQFRPFITGEAVTKIDWRRSARDDRLFVREREWETSKDFWLWIDQSTSMRFVSGLALESKIDRAYTLGLALSQLLVDNGERIGLIGLTPARASRNIIDKCVEALANNLNVEEQSVPKSAPLAPRSQAILISDFLDEPEHIGIAIANLAKYGAIGHLIAIVDPLEETFPFVGHTLFKDSDSSDRLDVGAAHLWYQHYTTVLEAHRQSLKVIAHKFHWSFSLHHTDRPTSEALLALIPRLEVTGSA